MFRQSKSRKPEPEESLPIDPQLEEDPISSTAVEDDTMTSDYQPVENLDPSTGDVEDTESLDSISKHSLGLDTVPEVVAVDPAETSKEEINAVRELILGLHPSIVPELISGDSVATLIASIAPAQQAYANIVSKMQVPAGGNPIISFDGDSLTTDEKIRRGLSAYQRKG